MVRCKHRRARVQTPVMNHPVPPGGGPLRHGRGRRSTLADLPLEVREEVFRRFRAGESDKAIAARLETLGQPVSWWAVRRFRKAHAPALRRRDEAEAAAAVWMRAEEGGESRADVARTTLGMLRTAAFHAAARVGSGDDALAEIARLARAVRDLEAAAKVALQRREADETRARERNFREMDTDEAFAEIRRGLYGCDWTEDEA